ncbi:hypothetical protein F4604DRAFT_1940268 [Suillus subluteus]|nr:hypothetical protein F4604DRAFT_1940268 [Suillus subluteus]
METSWKTPFLWRWYSHAHGPPPPPPPPHRYRSYLLFSSFIYFASITATTSSATGYQSPSARISHNSPSHGCNGLFALSPPFSSFVGPVVVVDNPSHLKFKRRHITARDEADEKRNPLHQIHSVPPLKEREDTMQLQAILSKAIQNVRRPYLLHVVSWGPQGNCFVVKDMNEFTKFGEHSLIFGHPDFHADRRDTLENIKRKVPAARKSIPSSSHGGLSAVAEAQAPAAL